MSAHWSPAAAGASLQPSSRSSWPLTSHPFNPGGCPLPPKKTMSAQVGKAPSPTPCPHSRLGASRPRRGQGRPAGEVPGSGLSRAGGRARSPAGARQRKRRPRGKATSRQAPRCPHRLGRKNGGGEARRRGGRRSEPAAPAHPALGTLAARRPRVRSACAAAPRRKSRRLAAGDWRQRSGNFAREMLPTLQPAEEDKNVRR